MGAVVAAARHH